MADTVTTEIPGRARKILFAGGLAALALVLLGLLNKQAYTNLALAAVMWSAAGVAMVVLGISFITVRRLFDTPLALLAAALLFLKAVLVVLPLLVTCREAAGFMDVAGHVRTGADFLFMLSVAWVVFRGRKMMGVQISYATAFALFLATLGLAASRIIVLLSGSTSAFLALAVLILVFLGFAGLGAGFIRMALRRAVPAGVSGCD